VSFTSNLLQAPAFRLRPPGVQRSLAESSPLPELRADIDLTVAVAQDVAQRLGPYRAQMTLDRSEARAGMIELEGWLNDQGRSFASLGADTVLPQDQCAYLKGSQARAFVSWVWIDPTSRGAGKLSSS
jgi:hypothetical protein